MVHQGLEFPNLPFIKDDDTYLSESIAVAMYLANKAKRDDLFGKTNDDRVTHESLLQVIDKLRRKLFAVMRVDNALKKYNDNKNGI